MATTPAVAHADQASAAARALGAHLPPLLVAAERVASTVTQGLHGRRRVGQGDSFWQFRPLLPGEGTQRIDWRRSARAQGAHFVRQTEWEAAQSVAVWRAATPSMHWRSLPALPSKLQRAELLLLALVSILLRSGERVRLLGDTHTDAAGLAGLPRVADRLSRDHAASERPRVDQVPRHACVVLMGDWLEPVEDIRRTVTELAEREVTGHVLQVLDPAEVELPYRGRVRFRGAGERAAATLIGRTESVRDAYAGRLAEQQARVRHLCDRAGLTFSVHRTDHSAVSALLSLYAALATPGGRR